MSYTMRIAKTQQPNAPHQRFAVASARDFAELLGALARRASLVAHPWRAPPSRPAPRMALQVRGGFVLAVPPLVPTGMPTAVPNGASADSRMFTPRCASRLGGIRVTRRHSALASIVDGLPHAASARFRPHGPRGNSAAPRGPCGNSPQSARGTARARRIAPSGPPAGLPRASGQRRPAAG